jgi:hypothetical protein
MGCLAVFAQPLHCERKFQAASTRFCIATRSRLGCAALPYHNDRLVMMRAPCSPARSVKLVVFDPKGLTLAS